jgi:hypothetical protein
MAFPGTFNFSYYKGDTYEFKIYPKDAAGNVFDLSDFTTPSRFVISTSRGTAGLANQVEAFSEISENGDFILCTIRPADGSSLSANTRYVYDVQVSKPQNVGLGDQYPISYTLLTGTVTVTDQIAGAV